MCGIVGLYTKQGDADPARLERAAERLAHRGPDDAGALHDGAFAMAHRRLSIIDLAGGHQPIDDGDLALIANGEIYNYVELREELERAGRQFITHSDSEVILHGYALHGADFLERLHGMFAFALYDRARGRVLLARDRLGIKPLFLADGEHGVAFGSEIKALMPLLDRRVDLDPTGLLRFIDHQFAAGGRTAVAGVERVAPGEAVVIEHGSVQHRWRYWSAREVQPASIGEDEAQAQLDTLMDQVMREHVRSDVPVGLFLSGGVDSAVLLGLLSRYVEGPVRTFSVGFADTRLHDELPDATRIARHFEAEHTEIRPTREEIFGSLPDTVWSADELMRDYACLPTALLAHAASRDLKVVFSGEGGDEVFAGYRRYRTSPVERALKALTAPGTGGFRARGTLRGRSTRRLLGERLRQARALSRQPFIDAWGEARGEWSTLARMQYTDLTTALPDNLLVKLDRMLMAWGVEGRVPFLDHRIVEFGLGLPDELKVDGRQGKRFLKRWAERFVPADHLYGPKRGFHVPIGEWLAGEPLARLSRVLPEHPAIREWFRPDGVRHLIRHYKPAGPGSRMIWTLLQIAVWHRLFVEGDGSRPEPVVDPIEFIG